MADVDKRPLEMDSSMDSTERDSEKEWGPIRPQELRTTRTRSRPGSRTTSIYSISRTRSQNGYSCADDETSSRDEEQGNNEKDPYEVGWDDGENDPMNPRSKSKTAKWAIVLICSFASFCV